MSCNITKLKRCEIAGSTFNSPTFTIPIRDLTYDTFYAIVRNSFGAKIQTIAGIKSGQTITFPYSTLEPLKGRLTVEFWGVFAGLGTEMFAIELFEICSNGSCGGEDSTIQNFDIVFKTVTVPVTLTYSVVNLITNQYLDFDDLTPEQKEALSFQYEDFTPEQILDLKQPAIDAAIVANAAADNANDKAILAEAAATNANDKATLANQKAGEAQTATTTANNAASNANAKATEAQDATENANTATSNANTAATNANTAAATANNAKGWSPLLVADTTTIAGKTLMKLSSWIGGTGTTPTTSVGQWQKADGTYTDVASDALDFKGSGVPIGGTTGQKLVKKSNTNYDFEFKDDTNLIGSYIHTGNLAKQIESIDYATNTITISNHGFTNSSFANSKVGISFNRGTDIIPTLLLLPFSALNGSGFYPVNVTTNTFQLSLLIGGSVITLVNKGTIDFTKFKLEQNTLGGTVQFNNMPSEGIRVEMDATYMGSFGFYINMMPTQSAQFYKEGSINLVDTALQAHLGAAQSYMGTISFKQVNTENGTILTYDCNQVVLSSNANPSFNTKKFSLISNRKTISTTFIVSNLMMMNGTTIKIYRL